MPCVECPSTRKMRERGLQVGGLSNVLCYDCQGRKIAAEKLAELGHMNRVTTFAQESLDPDSYTELLVIFTRLAETRHNEWEPF